MNERNRRRAGITLCAFLFAANYSPWVQAAVSLPDSVVLSSGQRLTLHTGLPMDASVRGGAVMASALKDGTDEMRGVSIDAAHSGDASVTFSLFGLPVHETKVSVLSERVLIPGGQAVGIALRTDGVLVVDGSGQEQAVLRPGDVILSVEGRHVLTAKELAGVIADADSDTVSMCIMRGGEELALEAKTPHSGRDGERRLGVWVRDSTAGVGTLSYIDPETLEYGALGHAIVDADTGCMMAVADGAILQARVVGVARGEKGKAGELRGTFLSEGRQIGSLERNGKTGVYGAVDALPENPYYPQGLPIAASSEVKPGPATILSTVEDGSVAQYDVEIVRCYAQAADGAKDMLIRITDEELIDKTGGIVQGMSGSPIIQDGKLVGAVTHVLVNDPTRGYGIFIENMLEAAE